MTYMHINTVNYDDLEQKEKVGWLEVRAGDEGFVLITDGDQSLQRDFEATVMTLEEVLADVSPNESIVFAEEAPFIEGFTKGKSYWGHEILTKDMD